MTSDPWHGYARIHEWNRNVFWSYLGVVSFSETLIDKDSLRRLLSRDEGLEMRNVSCIERLVQLLQPDKIYDENSDR